MGVGVGIVVIIFVLLLVMLVEIGSMLFYLLFNLWGLVFYERYLNVMIIVQGIGFGVGIVQVVVGMVNIGVFDVYLLEGDMVVYKGLMNIVLVIFVQQVNYNLFGVSEYFKLNGKVLVVMYQGIIKIWDDLQIVVFNFGVNLFGIVVVLLYCFDGFGDIFLFIQYLFK